jgi:Tetracyclin repressor-like, C-terminal domain
VIERGIARGDLRPETDVQLLHEFLLGPTFYRLLLSGGSLDRNLATRLVDAIVEGFAPRRAPARRRTRGRA